MTRTIKHRWHALALGACLAQCALGRTAQADVTVESLVGGSVTEVGPYHSDLADAIRKFAGRDYSGAMANLEHAKQTTPKLPPAEVMMAQLYFDANQPGPALVALDKCLSRIPPDPEPMVMLAERAVRESRNTEAVMLVDRALAELSKFNDNPRRRAALTLRAYSTGAAAHEGAGAWGEAQAKLEQLIKLEPKDASAHQRLARVLFRQGKQREAYAEFQAASEADPEMPSAELAMGTITPEKARSEQWFNLALQKGEKDAKTRLGVANFYLQSNRTDEAREHAAEAIKLDPDGREANIMAGLLARYMGDFPTAIKHLETAHLLAPADIAVTNSLALSLIEMPDPSSKQRALQYAQLNARMQPNSLDIVASLGWVNLKLNNLAEAERNLALVLNSVATGAARGVSPDVGFYLSTFYARQGNTMEAARLLTDAMATKQLFFNRKAAGELLEKLKSDKPAESRGSRAPAADTAGSK